MADDNPASDNTDVNTFDAIMKVDVSGIEYWFARDLQSVLGYARWENFRDAVERAKLACEGVGVDPFDHFRDVTKMIPTGKGAIRDIPDIALTRYGVYLTAMNGDPSKPEIAAAQSYFAVQTRKQEQVEELRKAEARIELRDRIKEDVKALNSAAQQAGVTNYGLFHDAGYRGLYGGLGLGQIKERKGLGEKEDLLDRASRAELAANDFRITQTEQKIRRENVKGEIKARTTHRTVGQEVRQTIKKLGGDMPENLPPEPSIKKLASGQKKRTKSLPPHPGVAE
ncbi:MAG: DNA damage-inducible protein D [Dehalococcoidia bacterium]|nr:DNA damage-inducible protein D [Dehalococcoidia bacterium]